MLTRRTLLAASSALPLGLTAVLEFMRGSTFIGTLPTSPHMTRQTAHPNVPPMPVRKFEDYRGPLRIRTKAGPILDRAGVL